MSKRTLRHVDITKKLSEQSLQYLEEIEDTWKQIKPDTPCVSIDGLILIKCIFNEDTTITLETPKKQEDPVQMFPEHLQEAADEARKKYKLAKKHLNQLNKILNLESTMRTQEEQNKLLYDKALAIYQTTRSKKIKSLCESLVKHLDSSLLNFAEEDKTETIIALDDTTNAINRAKENYLT